MQARELSGPGQSRIYIDFFHACRNDPDADADSIRGSCGKTRLPRMLRTSNEAGAGRRAALQPAFLTGFCSEAAQTGMDTRRATGGRRRRT
jgi:hypothetical protein